MEIGKRIQKYRKQAGLTQKQLAEKLGIVTGTMQQYELGKRQPRLEQLKRIADVLNVPWFELLENEDDRLKAAADFAWEVAEDTLKKYRKSSDDLFVEMYNSNILQELARRRIKLEERRQKRKFELDKREYSPLSEEEFEQRVRDHIVDLLYQHDVFPRDSGSLMAVGYSAGMANYIMKSSKVYSDDNVGILSPDYFEKAWEMVDPIDLSVKYDQHNEED